MKCITATSIGHAYAQGMAAFQDPDCYKFVETRNGLARVYNTPVTTCYLRPMNRVLMDPIRDANPFFHFFESLWILAGRKDVAFLSYFNKKIGDYTDDGINFHGAYGDRLINNFGFDQLNQAIQMLKKNPKDRRIVMSIWDPTLDCNTDSKDIPCNDMIKFNASTGVLDIIVFNRSNDMIWGAYGANVVQFSTLQEYVSLHTRIPLGRYYQISSDYHVYNEIYDKLVDKYCLVGNTPFEYIPAIEPEHYPMGNDACDQFDLDLELFFSIWEENGGFKGIENEFFHTTYFRNLVIPMAVMFRDYKENIEAPKKQRESEIDWILAGRAWISRRKKK